MCGAIGIDVAAISSHPGHLLVFDCEGGNNALSKSHSIVTVAVSLAHGSLFLRGGGGGSGSFGGGGWSLGWGEGLGVGGPVDMGLCFLNQKG